MVIAFCGLDGSLLEPPVSRETEDWPDIESVLRPLLQDLKAARLNAGISLDLSIPVFHSTDSYRKRHILIKKLYSEIWPDLALTATGLAPKGDAVRAEAHPYGGADGFFKVTGEPMHDIINLRRIAQRTMNDYSNLLFDHIDMINRLSAASSPPPPDPASCAAPVLVDEAARALLKMAIQNSCDVVQKAARDDPVAADLLKGFLRHPKVRKSRSWKALFGSAPPRGTLARVAKWLKVQLPPTCGYYRWQSQTDCDKNPCVLARRKHRRAFFVA